jgi:hypothetical protein
VSAGGQLQKECRDCAHHRTEMGGELCLGDIVVKPVAATRHFRGRCGPEGKLFKPKRGKGKKK